MAHQLSIIIPHFNSIELLKKLLLSIPEREEIQVIVIDDKSTEQEEMFLELSDQNQSLHRTFLPNNTGRKGAGVCRNIGLDHATGKWILFADADDQFTNEMYDIVSPLFTSKNDIVFFKPSSINMETGEMGIRHNRFVKKIENFLEKRGNKEALELRYKFEVPWSKLIRREMLVRHAIRFEEVMASNDVIFSTKVGYYAKDFEVSQSTIYIVTQGSGSLTGNRSEEIFWVRFEEKKKYYHFLKEHLTSDELSLLQISFLVFLLRSGKYGIKKFFQFFSLLLRHKLPVFNSRVLNPLFLFQAIKQKRRI